MFDAARTRLAIASRTCIVACLGATALAACTTPHVNPQLSEAVVEARAHRNVPPEGVCPPNALNTVSPIMVGFGFGESDVNNEDLALPLVAGYLSRKWLIAAKGEVWFRERFLHVLTPVTILALLATLVLLFSFKGEVILSNPLTILWIAIPLFIQTNLIFWIGYWLSRPAGGSSGSATSC